MPVEISGKLKRFIDSRYSFWLLLSLPALGFIPAFMEGRYKFLIHPTGEFAARFMILSLMLTPLVMLFPRVRWIRWLMRRRRYIGVAAFGYGLLHTLAYIAREGTWAKILEELPRPGIWTGWLAMAIFVVLGVTSNNHSLRLFGSAWKKIQRLAYLAALLTLAHWVLVSHGLGGIIVHFAPLALLEFYRIGRDFKWWQFSFN